jgi:3-keto-5-aminohexanoate cleavage enzyme
MEKLIITVALTGNVPTQGMNAALPVTAKEIADDIRRCSLAGASLFHIHARDDNGRPTLDPAAFKRIVRAVKNTSPEVILQLSTGGRAGKGREERAAPVRLMPEMASFTTGSSNMPGMVYENAPDFLDFLSGVFQETGVRPEIEVFEAGMVSNALYLLDKGQLSPPLHFDFVLGVPGAMPATVKHLLFLSELIPQGSTWSVAGIGRAEIPMAAAAIVMGGHVRVGLEDNLRLPDGSPATNSTLVDTVVGIARSVGREVATPEEARAILSLDPLHKDRILSQLD